MGAPPPQPALAEGHVEGLHVRGRRGQGGDAGRQHSGSDHEGRYVSQAAEGEAALRHPHHHERAEEALGGAGHRECQAHHG